MSAHESRRARQVAQIRDLCECGALGRAVALAYEHVAEFGADDEEIVDLLARHGGEDCWLRSPRADRPPR